jgi:16S rRNA (cytidine1402-2'-O)-methyltransferase
MSRLVLVATPIGNLGDLSPRAIEEFRAAGLVCCEDTRRTGLLLNNLGIEATLMRLDDHTEVPSIPRVIDALDDGRDVVLATDAGTPGISDPGQRLVSAVIAAGHEVTAVPGASAVLTALTISGLPTDRFVFEGFLPRSGKDRDRRLVEIASEPRTIVLYEAPHRIERTLTDLIDVCGPARSVAVCRELTKLHEEVRRGSLAEMITGLGEPRGEYVIVLAGAPPAPSLSAEEIESLVRAEIAAGSSTRDAAASVAARTGAPKKNVYDALAISKNL